MISSTKLLASINLKGSLPEGRFTDEEILDLAYDVILGDVQPLILAVREEYFVRKTAYPIEAQNARYSIPSRSVGSKLREIKLIRGSQTINLSQIGSEEVTTIAQGQPNSFYLESDDVILYPTPSSSQDFVEMSYFLRVSKPVAASSVAVVTDSIGGVLSATIPQAWTLADSFDVVSRSKGEVVLQDAQALVITPNDITFSDTTSIQVGDYISLAGESFLIQLPAEAVPLLSMLTVVELLNSLGDLQAMQAAQLKAEQLRVTLTNLLTTRVLGEPRRFSPQV